MNEFQQIEFLTKNLPDAWGARRFFAELAEKYPSEVNKLLRANQQGLLSDVLALAGHSPFLATTLLQHREYLVWLGKKRVADQVSATEDLLESLARFSSTNSQLDPHVLLSRFRRRELLRIYLRDIRGLATIAEITEELSNLADAILSFALKIARQEIENRYGAPLEKDERGRVRTAEFCVVALGKLGSKELNYASDVDLLFIYSNDGATSGAHGAAKIITNKEFFVKLSELIAKIVGQATGEGAAYRVDLRLRPHGRVGALAISCREAVKYYQTTARDWERQVMIRARAAAGETNVFKSFYALVETSVYAASVSVAETLESVRLSKLKIDREHSSNQGFNVKLGRGGIREIEFIAQALQLAHGGADEWLRVAHTLISLSRLADRGHLSEQELTDLSDAYAFLRSLEHRLQMENGLQTHAVSRDDNKRLLVAKQIGLAGLDEFDSLLKRHTENVSNVFRRVFESSKSEIANVSKDLSPAKNDQLQSLPLSQNSMSVETANEQSESSKDKLATLNRFKRISPHFGEILTANPTLINAIELQRDETSVTNYAEHLVKAVTEAADFPGELAALRTVWSRFYLEIAVADALKKIKMRESNRRQTALAEASLKAALIIVAKELSRKFGELRITNYELPISILALGRLAGRGMDYGSDLDLILIYDDAPQPFVASLTNTEFYSRAVEILTTALSSLTRHGYLYRVDLRLRPDGKNGASAMGENAFLNYLETRSAIWEWLAYVKLRSVGSADFARSAEFNARQIIHQKALQANVADLKSETRRIRFLLEQRVRPGEIDIKRGAGGLLDAYFAVRFLQLRDAVFDQDANRTTSFTLQKLRETNSLSSDNFEILSSGYEFLRALDHALRLVAGRSVKLPSIGNPLLEKIVTRLNYDSPTALLAALAVHTAEIRTTFETLLE